MDSQPQPFHVPLGIPAPPVPGSRDIERICRLAHSHFGLDLLHCRDELVAARLGRMVTELGFSSFRQYCDHLEADRTGAALVGLADRITTNHTSFFREPEHFQFLRTAVLPALRRRPRIEIWSAGCSSGEEPYSIAISLLEELPDAAQRVRIRATDLSVRMLARAAEASYSQDRIRPVPASLATRWFLLPSAGSMGPWRIAPEVRAMVDFRRVNLLDPSPCPCSFAVIFCRNVMLYLHDAAHRTLLERLCSQLEDGGYLFIGHADSMRGVGHNLELVFPAVYRKPGRLRPKRNSQVAPSSVEGPPCWP
ncbi:MAG TPA: protein-glutamate O-methyltransferase CheR [Acidobacteriaceae bacterium]|nr:protein-glutamate O-methyltransferase CheR [Acidobacteriaceae bacterium]